MSTITGSSAVDFDPLTFANRLKYVFLSVCGLTELDSVADQLFEEWQVYEKLLIHDYMDHRAFFARLQAEVQGRFRRPPAILDLGCGDLTPILPMLAGVPVRRYVGIDESDVALAIAASRLDELGQLSRLIRGDLVLSLIHISEPTRRH